MSNGDPAWVTAARWGSLSPANNFSGSLRRFGASADRTAGTFERAGIARPSLCRPTDKTGDAGWRVSRVSGMPPPGSFGIAVAVAALALAEIIAAIANLSAAWRPDSFVTFVGYLAALFLVMPLALVLARLEPTRWGALIVTVAAVIVPVLVLRILQVGGGGA